MKFNYLVALLCFFTLSAVYAQQNEGPIYVGTVADMEYVPSIASRGNLTPAVTVDKEAQDGRSSRPEVVPGKDPQVEDDFFARNVHRLASKIPAKAPILVFDAAQSSSQPTDPSLAVGPDHVFVVFNTGFIIYDKDGNALTGQISPNPTIFPNGGCCDLTVSYDSAVDRWVLSFLGGGAQIAVSDGPDPINDGWFTYTIPQINDYQKLSVWSDGYYITDNTSSTNKVWALERDEMLAGNPSAQILGFNLPGIVTSGFFSPQALNVTDDTMPDAGGATIIYLQDDAWSGVTEDHVKLWTIDVDWDTPANSTVSTPTELTATPFISVFDGGSFSNLTQPGGGVPIDALQATIMNQAQFRKFGTHNSALFNFVIDVDASSGEKAAVRWYELRQDDDNQPWTIYQEGTYVAPDTPTGGEKHAWHASMMMDLFGNIGMGYSGMTVDPNDPNEVRVSSYYTGRFAGDPLGTMTVAEELIANGNQNIPGLRYGDYSKIDIDPSNDKTFWFINEYMNSGRKDVVGVFQIAPDFNNDTGAINIDEPNDGDLSATEEVTVTIFNFGLDPQSNIPLTLSVDGTEIATETFTGTIASATSAQYTFTATVDLSTEGETYEITVATGLPTDEDNGNDAVTKEVEHVLAADLGVTAITSPTSGNQLGLEDVTVEITNYGTDDQSNFNVYYKIDETTRSETVTGPVPSGGTLTYTFNTQADLTVTREWTIEAGTQLTGDGDLSNDTAVITIENRPCGGDTNDTNMPIGPNAGTVTESIISVADDFLINEVLVTLNLTHTFTGDLDIFLEGPDGTTVELSTDNGGSGANMINTTFDDNAADPITGGTAPFTGSFRPEGNLSDFAGLSSLGDWTLRITDDANQDGGQLQDWTLSICSDDLLDINDTAFGDGSELIIINQGNDQYQLQLLTTQVTERLELTVMNMLGQTLLSRRIDNENGTGYEYNLDMSYVSSGVYIVRIGNKDFGSVKRIIVR